MAKSRQSTKAVLGFEEKLWASANVLRGNLPSSEYKSVILGLIFLKYINDKFSQRYAFLVKEGDGWEEDPDEYIGEQIFFVPYEARWEYIANTAHDPEIGLVIDRAMQAIENSNPRLKGILPKNYSRPELDKRRLGEVIDIFTNINLKEEEDKDVLGRTYEYCLGKFAEAEGQRGGEFYTPQSVVRTLVEVLQPFEGRVYDPACGSGGMFVQSKEFINRHQGSLKNISIYGQELNSTTWKLALMNLAIRGLDPDLGKIYADTFFDDQHPTLKAEYVMANPPFNMKNWGLYGLQDDPRWQYGLPPESNANFAWMQHMIYHMHPTLGRMGLVLANGSLSSKTGNEGEIRKKIIEDDLVEGIVAMPSQLFYTTGIAVCIWFLSKNKKQAGKTLFIDARQLGELEDRKHKVLRDSDIEKIARCFDEFRKGRPVNEDGFAAVADIKDIKEQDYILTPGRYVGVEKIDAGNETKDVIFSRLSTNLDNLFLQTKEMQYGIQKTLYDWGYTITLNNDRERISNNGIFFSIDNLRQTNKNLKLYLDEFETTLFKSWFIDFDPFRDGDFKQTIFGLVPACFNIIKFEDFLIPVNDKVQSNAGYPEYSVTNTGIIPRSDKFTKKLSKPTSMNKVIKRGNIVFGMSREILNWGVMEDDIGCVSTAYHVYKINENIILPQYLKLFMQTRIGYFKDLIGNAAREGQSLDKEALLAKIVYVPPRDLWDDFCGERF